MRFHRSGIEEALIGAVALIGFFGIAHPAPAGPCGPGNGDCCIANETPGCDDEDCCLEICETIDKFCCDVFWDSTCASIAGELCEVCDVPDVCDFGDGDCCQEGGNGTPGCDNESCCNTICAANPFCCEVEWDETCAEAALKECGHCQGVGAICDPEAGDCCQEGGNGTPGCDDEDCCLEICETIEPFCCDTSWDGMCADIAQDLCGSCQGGGGEGPRPCDNDENDLCEDAFVISDGDIETGNTCDDACNDGSSDCGGSEANLDVWYSFTPGCDGSAHAETCGSSYDTVLSVHSGCPGDFDNEIVCNDDFCGFQSGVDWAFTAGTTYLIRVSGFADHCGDFTLTVDKDCDCDPLCDDSDQCTDDVCNDDGTCSFPDNGECCQVPLCEGDVNGSGNVDPLDSGAILARFGLDPCNEENCVYDVNCDGAIDPLDSGFVLARFGVCNEPEVCNICSNNVFNDNCEDASVDSLSIGETNSYDGDNTDATLTCAAGGFEETWHAMDLTESADVTTSLCGTEPPFGTAYIVIDPSCPCSGAFVFATSFDQTTCTDGNWAIHYDALPAGQYYTPVLKDGTRTGKYMWNISAQ
ncbi:MAG: hypothetical protein IH988_08665 [Planctomycetes bacterium]|nr:hypothetical protein [Planctomycetota bacterium]